ncbi:hypothetical protein BT69DRAFT_1132736 [Atractiella rhizophila]|nr:hypothetical protein BT69DRAFT_1132736 [Atractiella rhizophila]
MLTQPLPTPPLTPPFQLPKVWFRRSLAIPRPNRVYSSITSWMLILLITRLLLQMPLLLKISQTLRPGYWCPTPLYHCGQVLRSADTCCRYRFEHSGHSQHRCFF